MRFCLHMYREVYTYIHTHTQCLHSYKKLWNMRPLPSPEKACSTGLVWNGPTVYKRKASCQTPQSWTLNKRLKRWASLPLPSLTADPIFLYTRRNPPARRSVPSWGVLSMGEWDSLNSRNPSCSRDLSTESERVPLLQPFPSPWHRSAETLGSPAAGTCVGKRPFPTLTNSCLQTLLPG